MKKIFAVLAAGAAALFLSACGPTRGELEANKRAEAAESKLKELERKAPTVATAPASDELVSMAGTPCFKFATTAAGAKRQEAACNAWLKRVEERATASQSGSFWRANGAHKALWRDYPALAAKHLELRDRRSAAVGTPEYEALDSQVKELLRQNPDFAANLAATTPAKTPLGTLKHRMYIIAEMHAEIAKFVLASGDLPR